MTNEPKTAQPADRNPAPATWKSTEFWTHILTPAAAVILPTVVHSLPPTVTAVLTTVSGVAYMISRGLAKFGIGAPPQ